MLTVNTLSKKNVATPGKVVAVQVDGRLYGLGDDLNSSRVDIVVYRGEPLRLPHQVQGGTDLATGGRDKVAIGGGNNARKTAIERVLMDAGASPGVLAEVDNIISIAVGDRD